LAHYRDRLGMPSELYKWTERGNDFRVSEDGIVESITTTIQFPIYGSLFYRRVSPGDPISGFDDNGLPMYGMNMLPATVEAENFDYFTGDGEGRTYSDTSFANQGFAYRFDTDVDILESAEGDVYIGSTSDGEFLTYTVSVPETDEYNFLARVATGLDGANIRFSIDGEDMTGVVAVPNTGSFLDWANLTVARDVPLSQGVHQVKIDIVGSAFTLDNFTISDVLLGDVLRGDVNLDGIVDFSDISSFITVLVTGEFQLEADCDENGVVNFSDIQAFIEILTGL